MNSVQLKLRLYIAIVVAVLDMRSNPVWIHNQLDERKVTFFKYTKRFRREIMRLTTLQRKTIKSVINQVLDVPYQVWLFGSRVDDHKRGGDIDLLVEAEAVFSNRAEVLCRLHGSLIMALGDRKLDILLKDARTGETAVFEIARRTGVML